ncbi:MAG: hypothetical protein P8I52_07185 [Flavobacteriales bacterium]|nr:hypothetical protein [Flavobacteriales bacterium]
MKKLLYLLILPLILFLVSCGGGGSDELIPIEPIDTLNIEPIDTIYTYVTDNNFEIALIGLGLDNTLNDTVLTAAIDTITFLDISFENISDLTGIENFTALTNLYCNNNNLTSLDLSNNTALTFLQCRANQLTSLDISNNTALTSLDCRANQLTSLDISNNTSLTTLDCNDNQLTSLDVSNNTSLTNLYCKYNQLTSLDLRNGNNTNLLLMASYNPFLYCIDVDNVTWSNSSIQNLHWHIASQSFFSEDCVVK